MILSVSRRTDIPAFYGTWFMNRLRAGWCDVENPRRPGQVSRIALAPESVAAIVFWTRDPAPMFPHLAELERLGFLRHCWLITLTGYPGAWEPGAPVASRAVVAIRELAARVGSDRVAWRYDPIILTRRFDAVFHRTNFRTLCGALEGCTRRVIVSLHDSYRHAAKNIAAVLARTDDRLADDQLSAPGLEDLLSEIHAMASQAGMEMQSCAEDAEIIRAAGIPRGACIDAAWLRRIFGVGVRDGKDPGQRTACLCSVARDIGAPDTCPRGCVYCYATRRPEQARSAHARHDPGAASLRADGFFQVNQNQQSVRTRSK